MSKYKVVGSTPFGDHEPGEEFEADLDPDFEERAIERGSIELVSGKPKKAAEEE